MAGVRCLIDGAPTCCMARYTEPELELNLLLDN
jgi:hypothetical protein